ncbi:MAG: hypothetical protein HGA67_02005 [Candidatus Yonathbacteria bacterium]|nr:hypothetical protein [Candidatus Yonathbacteria bacterium]
MKTRNSWIDSDFIKVVLVLSSVGCVLGAGMLWMFTHFFFQTIAGIVGVKLIVIFYEPVVIELRLIIWDRSDRRRRSLYKL